MRLPAGYKLSLACARTKEEIEKASNLVDPVLSREGGRTYLSASTGILAVALQLDDVEPDDRDGWIPVEVIEGAEEHRTDEYVPLITAGDRYASVVLSEVPHQTLIATRCDTIPTPVLDLVLRTTGSVPDAEIRVNAKLLLRLAKAIGTERVTLKRVPTGGTSYMIVVERAHAPDARCRALIAPVRPSDSDSEPASVPVEPGEQAELGGEEKPEACSVCGERVTTTVSISTGGEPTPPTCLKCMAAITDAVKGAARG